MLNVLHSYYKPICLALLVLLGLASGHLVDSLLQIKLRSGMTGVAPAGPFVAEQAPAFTESDLNRILQQNLFDANNRSATATMQLSAAGQGGEEAAAPAPPADLKLVGTVAGDEDPLALIQVNKELGLFRLDEELPGGGVIETIERSQVTIRFGSQRLVTLLLHEQVGAASGAAPGVPAAAPASRAGQAGAAARAGQAAAAPELAGTIREVGENRWMLSEDMVESVRENFAAQLRLAQMQPRLVDGRTEGFLVRRINPRSVLAKMGLQRGDVVIDVNNIKLDSPEKALQVFQQLREARRISVAVERDGQPLSFTYEVE